MEWVSVFSYIAWFVLVALDVLAMRHREIGVS